MVFDFVFTDEFHESPYPVWSGNSGGDPVYGFISSLLSVFLAIGHGYTMLTRLNMGLAIKQFAISTVSLLLVSFIPAIMIRYRNLRNY